jgi:Na+-translocating ferredoxin:NAD+ oxidoreductase RnfD subunit
MSNGPGDRAVVPPIACDLKAKRGERSRQIKPFLAPLLITCILLVGDWTHSILPRYEFTVLAILSAIVLEILLRRVATGRWPHWLHLASCYITGISVGILVQVYVAWPFVLCSMLSISSKYALRLKGRHLWNPSNFGVSVFLFLNVVAPLSQQWGNEMWPMVIILCLGSVILYTLGRLHITLTYAAAFTVLSLLRTQITGNLFISEIALLTSPAYQLFMFFMITDPATTTRTKGRQCAVAILVAVVETIFRLERQIHAPYYALFITAPVTNLIEIWWEGRRQPARPALEAVQAPIASGNIGAMPSGR